jgi:hypothetical protein
MNVSWSQAAESVVQKGQAVTIDDGCQISGVEMRMEKIIIEKE